MFIMYQARTAILNTDNLVSLYINPNRLSVEAFDNTTNLRTLGFYKNVEDCRKVLIAINNAIADGKKTFSMPLGGEV